MKSPAGSEATEARSRNPRFDVPSVMRLTELADIVVPFAIRVACELRIADELADGPRTVDEIARSVGADPRALLRLLRALTARGIFTEVEPGLFGHTALSEPLRDDHPLSMREAYPLIPADIQAWSRFDVSVRTGGSAFEHVHGQGYWEHMAERPEEAHRFDGTQRAATRLELRTILPAYDGWATIGSLVDAGGGNGAFLAGILRRFRDTHGTLLDLPHVVAGADEVLRAAGVRDRCTVVGGSFFDEIPQGADAYLLKRVLYHWDDDHARTLLSNLRSAMRPDSRLLLLEPVAEPGDELNAGKLYDLILLTMAGGGLRSLEEIEALLDKSGLRLARVVRTMMFPMMEIVPR
ncbi:O-methyltransferase [Saccharomonospora cyanea NA-134]|uniref:O-methyltransferase n=2 Tax=Saccharomonospora cyanea TaxID=40989 RepID=H5XHK1_9PSEU|nr:O-methyltransferase [Saccharomonospora cyanea NA-134]